MANRDKIKRNEKRVQGVVGGWGAEKKKKSKKGERRERGGPGREEEGCRVGAGGLRERRCALIWCGGEVGRKNTTGEIEMLAYMGKKKNNSFPRCRCQRWR